MNTTIERNRLTLDRMHEAIELGGLTAQLPFFAEQSLNHGFTVTRDDIRAVLEDILNTFPDVRFEPEEIVAEGDLVVVRYTMIGTHLGVQKLPFVHGGVLFGVAPTGKQIRVKHAHIWRFKDGQVIAHDAVQDNLEMARQLGVLPGR